MVPHLLWYLQRPANARIHHTRSVRNYKLFKCICVASPTVIVEELCESRGGRPELSVLTSLLVFVDVKNY